MGCLVTSYAHFVIASLGAFYRQNTECLKMSSASNSSSSSSESEVEECLNEEFAACSGTVPYDENLEPLATPEEAAEYEARHTEEVELEREYQARFTREVEVTTWYDKLTVVYNFIFCLAFDVSTDYYLYCCLHAARMSVTITGM